MEKVKGIMDNKFISWLITVTFAVGTYYALTGSRISFVEKTCAENKAEIVCVKGDLNRVREEQNKILMDITIKLSRIEGKMERK